MYLQYFGLSEPPFAITPDPAFVYLSDRHRDALAHLLFGVGQGGSGGFVQLTGEVGTGKTTLCRCLLEQVPAETRIALVLNPLVTPVELLTAICEELQVPVAGAEGSSKVLVDRLTHYLLQAHREGARVVVVIDEAQNLAPEALEQVRLLTNLETTKEKLLQIVLLGQPELREMLQRRSLRQLAQRITARYHLTPLSARDTERYVQHRMQVAGAERNPFRRSALKALFQRSHGIPRLINIIADRSLVAAYAGERPEVNARLVHAAADEVQLGEPEARRTVWPWVTAAAALAALAIAVGMTLPTATVIPSATEAHQLTETAAVEPARAEVAGSRELAPADISPPTPAAVIERAPTREYDALDVAWLATQSEAAWRGMASAWASPADAWAVKSACRGTEKTGYACVYNQGNWSRIQKLGWPVILVLEGPQEHYLLLRGIDEEALLVGTEDDERVLSRREIADRWLGAYLVAWPQSPNWPKEVRRGDSGPAVDTVLQLAGLADEPLVGATAFDVRFERWLMGFQQRHGLEMDGIVGPKTLLYLMRNSVTEPQLLSRWPGSS
jgi:general secretion pathway protein A